MSASHAPIGFAAAENNSIGFTGPYALFECPICNLVESDTKMWKWDLTAGRFCCRDCDGSTQMMVQVVDYGSIDAPMDAPDGNEPRDQEDIVILNRLEMTETSELQSL